MKSAREIELEQLDGKFRPIERRVHELKADDDPGMELDERASKLMREQPSEFKEYSAAVEYVLKADEDLASRYRQSFGVHKLSAREQAKVAEFADDKEEPAGNQLDRLAKAIQREHPSWSYESCLNRAMEDHPDLKKKYAEKGA